MGGCSFTRFDVARQQPKSVKSQGNTSSKRQRVCHRFLYLSVSKRLKTLDSRPWTHSLARRASMEMCNINTAASILTFAS